jgi:hypothetical protein
MSSEPYLQAAKDGTFELVIPDNKGPLHVLPYCFHSEEDAMAWLSSRKGREQLKKISARESLNVSTKAVPPDRQSLSVAEETPR